MERGLHHFIRIDSRYKIPESIIMTEQRDKLLIKDYSAVDIICMFCFRLSSPGEAMCCMEHHDVKEHLTCH